MVGALDIPVCSTHLQRPLVLLEDALDLGRHLLQHGPPVAALYLEPGRPLLVALLKGLKSIFDSGSAGDHGGLMPCFVDFYMVVPLSARLCLGRAGMANDWAVKVLIKINFVRF